MIDYGALLISGSDIQEVSRSVTKVIQALPPEMRNQFRTILVNYIGWYGEGAYERMNNRSVSQIFAEYQPTGPKPIACGELEGVRCELYDAPSSGANDGEEKLHE